MIGALEDYTATANLVAPEVPKSAPDSMSRG